MEPEINSQKISHVPRKTDLQGTLVPLYDLVYIEPDIQADYITKAGIMVGKPKHQGVPKTGIVRYMGPGVTEEFKAVIKIGDRIVCDDPNMKGFHLNDVPLVPLPQSKIVAKIIVEG